MKFSLQLSTEILQQTPSTLQSLLSGLSNEWIFGNEGNNTWNPFDVVGHLIHGERTDWIPRIKIILEFGETKPFEPFDRFAQLEASKGKSLSELLETFATLRKQNLQTLKDLHLTEKELNLKGTHPELGTVTLQQLIATWVVHDLDHLAQTTRVMAKQYSEEVGVWKNYLSILKEKK